MQKPALRRANAKNNWLYLLQTALYQSGEAGSGCVAGFNDLIAGEGLIQYAGSHVGAEGEAQHIHAAVGGNDGFGNGGHTYRVSA